MFLFNVGMKIAHIGLFQLRKFVHSCLTEVSDEDNSIALMYQTISDLPQPNRDTLAFLILHLKRSLICFNITFFLYLFNNWYWFKNVSMKTKYLIFKLNGKDLVNILWIHAMFINSSNKILQSCWQFGHQDGHQQSGPGFWPNYCWPFCSQPRTHDDPSGYQTPTNGRSEEWLNFAFKFFYFYAWHKPLHKNLFYLQFERRVVLMFRKLIQSCRLKYYY